MSKTSKIHVHVSEKTSPSGKVIIRSIVSKGNKSTREIKTINPK